LLIVAFCFFYSCTRLIVVVFPYLITFTNKVSPFEEDTLLDKALCLRRRRRLLQVIVIVMKFIDLDQSRSTM